MSIVSGTIAALGNRKSAKEQNQITNQQNIDNLLLQLAARGAPLTGSNVPESVEGSQAAILPYYFGDLESTMGRDASAIYKASSAYRGSPEVQLADYQSLVDSQAGATNAIDQLAIDLATGKLTEDQIAEAMPSFAARRGVAEAKRNAGLEALQATLNEIDSIQAGKGYSGDSTGKRMLRFNARRGIGTTTAADLANVNLENALDERTIREQGRALRLANMNLPEQRIQSAVNRKLAPQRAVAQGFTESVEPFKFFNLGPHSFEGGVAPSAMPNTLGDIATQFGQTGVMVGGALSNYYKNKAQQDRYKSKTYEGDTGSWRYLIGSGSDAPAGTTYDSEYSYAPGVNPWASSY